ncbi:FAD-binding oxidoreductase [Spirosoma gilvum]
METLTIANWKGQLIDTEHPDYHSVRKVFNGMIDKCPSLIARCTCVDDVVTMVNYAREKNLLVSVRGGGHNGAGLGVCDDGLVIDLSGMKKVEVDTEKQTVRVEGGCLLKELDAATHAYGLVVPTGINGTTGVAGLTLGGGLGYLTRHCGLTIDNLLEATVVLADGRVVKASAAEHDDLFWAIRGGGGNFGIVTSFLFKAYPISTVLAGPILYELEDAKEIMQWYREYIKTAPDVINGWFAFLVVPPGPPFPEHLHLKKMCGILWCYSGPAEEADHVLAPIRAVKTPALDLVGPLPVPVLQGMFDALVPPGVRTYWKADYVNELTDEAIDIHLQHAKKIPTMLSTMHLYPVNGAAARISNDATAWSYRNATWAMVIVGIDPEAANDELITNWARNYWQDLHPHGAGGAYINFMMEEGEDRIKATYGPNYDRLVAIKTTYDPTNFFRVNQNIRPVRVETD